MSTSGTPEPRRCPEACGRRGVIPASRPSSLLSGMMWRQIKRAGQPPSGPTMARAHWHHHEGPQSRDYLNSESRLGPHWNPSTLVRGGLDGGGHTHSKGDVALHRHHGHRELDLRGRREKAGDGIEVSYPPGAPLYSPSRRTVCGSGTSDQPSMAKGASRAGQAPLQYPQRASGGCMMAVAQ
jgi:hypothetical protein